MGFNGKNIVDRFGRVHDYLRISLTERCNLRCFYCMPEEGIPLRDKSEFMTSEELLEIARTFVDLGVKKIRLTGGEPLVRKNAGAMIRGLGELGVELAITTNGVLVDRFIDDFNASGLRNVNVSLDSLKEDRFSKISRRNYFGKVKENIDLLVDQGFNTKINVVLMKGVNDDEIIDFIEWSVLSRVHVRFIEFMPFDGNNWNADKKVSQAEIQELVTKHYGKEQVIRMMDARNDTARNFSINGAAGTFGIISSVTNPFCVTCNRIRLTADGKLKNCLFSQTETDLLSAFRAEEPLEALILNAIDSKYAERGGLERFDDANIGKHHNRSMVRIGG